MMLTLILVLLVLTILSLLIGKRANETSVPCFLATIFAVVMIILIMISFSLRSDLINRAETLEKQYDNLLTYNEMLVDVKSELMRYKHFSNINDYNTQYETLVSEYNNKFMKYIYPKDLLDNLDYIEFKFNN